MKILSKEQRRISSINNKLAWMHFYPEGNGKAKKGYVLHHKDPSWKYECIDRYIQWNIEDLEMMTRKDHSILHNTLNPMSFPGEKNGMWKNGDKVRGEKNGRYGKPVSKETRKLISVANTGENSHIYGKHWFNNGIVECYYFECPEGFVKGRLPKSDATRLKLSKKLKEIRKGENNPAYGRHWFNNGVEQHFCKECPEGFVKGMLSFTRFN